MSAMRPSAVADEAIRRVPGSGACTCDRCHSDTPSREDLRNRVHVLPALLHQGTDLLHPIVGNAAKILCGAHLGFTLSSRSWALMEETLTRAVRDTNRGMNSNSPCTGFCGGQESHQIPHVLTDRVVSA